MVLGIIYDLLQVRSLEQTWRWYGPEDPVTLDEVRQAGATGIVTALHHVPIGEIWTVEEIMRRKEMIEAAGLRWSVIESLALHEDIKTRSGDYSLYINRYQTSLRNIGACGLDVLCYNVMPALDWTRTNLDTPYRDGSTALSFDWVTFAAFDIHLLERTGALESYSREVVDAARECFDGLSASDRRTLIDTCIAGLPGNDQSFDLETFRSAIMKYDGIESDVYRSHIKAFLSEVLPVAEAAGIRMAVHPDDPPFDILGLPRIVSTLADIREYLGWFSSPAHGLTLCAGSLGSRPDNDLISMVMEFFSRIHFLHLRNVTRYDDRSFIEDNHLDGDVDMAALMHRILHSEGPALPYRPDHGHRMADDLRRQVNPGYSLIGRLRGLAELRGLETAFRRTSDRPG